MSEMSHSQQGIRTMEANAANAIAATQEADAYAMDATFNQEALDARKASPEIGQLNDIAQIEIYGTNGKTEGFVDPNTGEPLTEPVKGILNEIRETSPLSTSASEREQKAKDTETEILGLVDEGLELSQAKLAWDLRQADDKSAANMISKYVADGMKPGDAETKVRGIYARKDAQRLNIIQKEGIFTAQEYKSFVDKKSAGNKKPATESPEDVTNGPERDSFRHGVFVKYDADQNGMVQRALEFSEPGDVIDWSQIPGSGLRMILTDRDGKKYIVEGNENGRDCYDLSETERTGDFVGWKEKGQGFSNVELGKGWQINESTTTAPIDKVEIALEEVRDNNGEAMGEERGSDPFRAAKELLDKIESDTFVLPPAEPLNDVSRQGIAKRARQIMGKAFKNLQDMSYMAGFKAQSGFDRVRKYFSEEEKGKKRKLGAGAVLGALALGALAYIELKGGGVPKHHGSGNTHLHHIKHDKHDPKVRLQKGQNPWTESEHQLRAHGNAHPTAAQIEDYDKRMAHDNPQVYSYEGNSSEHIPAGTELKLPS